MARVLVIGCGVVGTNLLRELAALEPDRYDKRKGIDERSGWYDLALVCVDTPKTETNACDVSDVLDAVSENHADLFVIKSTVLPGMTDIVRSCTGQHVVFSPEYYGSTQHNSRGFDFTILGGPPYDCVRDQQVLQGAYDAYHEFRFTDSRTAELAKYMENAWIATKVSFCEQFFDIAEGMEVRYEELRELFLLDPRVSPSHTYVYRDHPYWQSHCLDKDVPAIAELADAPLLKAVVEYNEGRKRAFGVQSGAETTE